VCFAKGQYSIYSWSWWNRPTTISAVLLIGSTGTQERTEELGDSLQIAIAAYQDSVQVAIAIAEELVLIFIKEKTYHQASKFYPHSGSAHGLKRIRNTPSTETASSTRSHVYARQEERSRD
jgi:hypothetical protein